MEIVGALHSRNAGDGLTNGIQGQAAWYAFQQNIRRVAQQNQCPRQHPQADADGDDRNDPGEAGETNGNGTDDDTDRTQDVGPDLKIGAFEVEATLFPGQEQEEGNQKSGRANI